MSNIQLWETWLSCPAVQAYESGKIGEPEFAEGVLSAFKSTMAPAAFLESFATWPQGLYPGMTGLLKSLRANYALGYLSNSNRIHYARFQQEWNLNSYFDFPFASHLMGMAKPEPGIFEHVVQAVPCERAEILFFDDNQINVVAAQRAGIEVELVRGPQELLHRLKTHDVDSITKKVDAAE